MLTFLTFVALPLVLLAVLASLLMGLIAMNRSGDKARLQSNILMRWRVGLHILAIALVVTIMVMRQAE